MSKEQIEFHKACRDGDLEKVKSLSNQVDVNWANPDRCDQTALHSACFYERIEVIKYILSIPQIDANIRDRFGCTPLLLAFWNEGEVILKVLVENRRVDLNMDDEDGQTPLWIACRYGSEASAKVLLASGRKIDTTRRTRKGTNSWNNTTATEIARKNARDGLAEVIEEYMRNPKGVAQRLRQELDWPTPASTVFAQTIFFSDGLLALQPEDNGPAHRFFSIAARLPLDLQHLLANRSQGLAGDNVPAADRELAFTSLARFFG